MDRREFVRTGAGVAVGTVIAGASGCRDSGPSGPGGSGPPVTFGFFTDLHVSTRAPAGTRHYDDALEKAEAFLSTVEQSSARFLVMGGDYIDHVGMSRAEAQADLRRIEEVMRDAALPRYHVLGNHCLDQLTKEELREVLPGEVGFFSWDLGGVHFVVLDACYTADRDDAHYARGEFDYRDTWVGPAQRAWLRDDLAAATGPVVVFAHQRLSGAGEQFVNNAAEVRTIMERAGNVVAVFTGHSHVNDLRVISGIPYFAMMAAVEQPFPAMAHALVQVSPRDGEVVVDGFGLQRSYPSPPVAPS